MRFVEILKLDPAATLPTRNITTDAGMDIYSSQDMFVPLGQTRIVSTGVAIRVGTGYVGKVEDRSSMAMKGLKVGGGVIDSGFAGQVSIVLHNLTYEKEQEFGYPSKRGYLIKAGDRIAQILFYEVATPMVLEVHAPWPSERSTKGFGSSGR